jgi:hypothetical protein
VVSSNSYWNSTTQKTYTELYSYYRPEDFYDDAGYYSHYYKAIYYDGYGYNFYNGNYGYYEFSRPPQREKLTPFVTLEFFEVLLGFVAILVLYSAIYCRELKKEIKLKKAQSLSSSQSFAIKSIYNE